MDAAAKVRASKQSAVAGTRTLTGGGGEGTFTVNQEWNDALSNQPLQLPTAGRLLGPRVDLHSATRHLVRTLRSAVAAERQDVRQTRSAMALIVKGTKCALCASPLDGGGALVATSAFIGDRQALESAVE